MTTITDYMLTTIGIMIVWASLFYAIGGDTLKLFEVITEMIDKLI